MRGLLAGGLVVALSSVAVAAPPAPGWADWVGAYRGKLVWRRTCTAPGEQQATLALDAIDGAVTIDLAPAGGGLRALSLTEERAGWAAQQGDVHVTVTRPRANAIDVVVTLESGCAMHGTLTRPVTGIASCDQLVGLARIEAACTKRGDAPLEDPAALAKERLTWKPAVKGLAARCTARGEKVRTALVTAGCAPIDGSDGRGGDAPHCRALLAVSTKLAQCPSVSPQEVDVLVHGSQQIASGAEEPDPTQRALADTRCEQTIDELREIATYRHCPL